MFELFIDERRQLIAGGTLWSEIIFNANSSDMNAYCTTVSEAIDLFEQHPSLYIFPWGKRFLREHIEPSLSEFFDEVVRSKWQDFARSMVDFHDDWQAAEQNGEINAIWPWPEGMKPGDQMYKHAVKVSTHPDNTELKDKYLVLLRTREGKRGDVFLMELYYRSNKARIELAGLAVKLAAVDAHAILKRAVPESNMLCMSTPKSAGDLLKQGVAIATSLHEYSKSCETFEDVLDAEGLSWARRIRQSCDTFIAKLTLLERTMSSKWAQALQRVAQSVKDQCVPPEAWQTILTSYSEEITLEHLVNNTKLDSLLDYLTTLFSAAHAYDSAIAQLPNKTDGRSDDLRPHSWQLPNKTDGRSDDLGPRALLGRFFFMTP